MFFSTGRWIRLHSHTKGYSLIEVLVAMAIFTSMITLATMALNQGLKQYQGLMEKGINFWSSAKHLWINRSMGSVADYYVEKGDERWFPYFNGNQDYISYVSLSPLAGDLPVEVWITVDRLNNGRQALMYYELPVYAKNYVEIEKDFALQNYRKGNSIMLVEGVEDISVDFYGFDFISGKNLWSRDYDGSIRRRLPSLIKISYRKEGKNDVLLFGINTSSTLKMGYNVF